MENTKKNKEKEAKDSKKVFNKFNELEKEIAKNKISIPQLHAWFKEEIERKDKEIQRLKKENDVLFRTAMKSREQMLIDNKKH